MRLRAFLPVTIIGLTIFLVLTGIWIFLSPETPDTDSVFPFEIQGGTLLQFDFTRKKAYIFNQGYNLTLLNDPVNVNQSTRYSVIIFNIQTKGLVVIGLENSESCEKLNETCVTLTIRSDSRFKRRITLYIDTSNVESYKFAVIGDTQGFTSFYEGLIKNASSLNYAFILHLGDITPFGTQCQFEKFNRITRQSKKPIFFTPGNHDVKQENTSEQYEKYFGKTDYSFIYGGILFISLDSSRGFFTENNFIFLKTLLTQYQVLPKIIFSHVPIFDPRENNDHSLLNKSQPERFFNLIQNQNVKIVLSGHIHFFNYTEINGMHFIISGGGGAALHEPRDKGGVHHFTEIEIKNFGRSVSFTPVELTKRSNIHDIIVIQGSSFNVISLNDLQTEFQTVVGNSSFQNQYGNWRAYGEYIGVRVSDLLWTVGGLNQSQVLEVEAWDGLRENYSYPVIFPNSTWLEIQGEMILAYSFNGSFIPDWTDGYRIVFLPQDHAYSNADCEATSPPGEGYHIWPSAGFRWIKFVKTLRIISGVP